MYSRFLNDSDTHNINLQIEINKESLQIIYDYDDEKYTITESLKDLKNKGLWKSGSILAVMFNAISKSFIGIINKTAETYATKQHANTIAPTLNIAPIQLVIPYDDADFTDVGIQVIQKKGTTLTISSESGKEFNTFNDSSEERRKQIREFLPTLTIEGDDTIGSHEAKVYNISVIKDDKMLFRSLVVYLESSAGVISKQKFTVNGTGKFVIRAVDLEVGDEIEVKAGFRFLTGKAHKTIQVV